MVLTGDLSTHVRGPRRKNLVIAAVVAAVVLGTAAGLVIAKFNDKPVWPMNVAYGAGYYDGSQLRKTDRDGSVVAAAVAGGCERAARTAGKKADDSPAAWVRGCLDAVQGKPSTPNAT
ncbi:hypothetical protein ACH4SP_28950 [Streptomyces sp. NPDC021093]|uniref:hypothetical protein n=1 Tax=Streptomyces sp. NPDC021093 TaxID=3365112 RepID=UPI0037937251